MTIWPRRPISANCSPASALCFGAPEAGATMDQKRILEFAGWRVDVTHRHLYSAKDALVPLRAGEFELLLALVERPQRVLSRDQLLDLSRGRSANVFDR